MWWRSYGASGRRGGPRPGAHLGRTLDADEAEALVQLGQWTEAEAILDAALAEARRATTPIDCGWRTRAFDSDATARRPPRRRSRHRVARWLAGAEAADPVGPRLAVRRSWLGATEVAAEAAILAGDPGRALEILAGALAAAAADALTPDEPGPDGPSVEPGLALEPAAVLALWAVADRGIAGPGATASEVLERLDALIPHPVGPFARYLAAERLRATGSAATEEVAAWEVAADAMAANGLGWWSGWARDPCRGGRGRRRAAGCRGGVGGGGRGDRRGSGLGAVAERGRWLARRLGAAASGGQRPLGRAGSRAGRVDASRSALTTREHDVLALVVIGFSNREIADRLGISHKTASVHVSNILGKLEVENRTEAAAVAVRLGLVGDGSGG